LEAGQRIRDYLLEEKIGAGGAGEVWRARHQYLDDTVAMKAIYRHAAQGSDFQERFLEEAKVMASLKHPHIAAVRDFFFLDGVPYLVMTYIAGGSLADVVAQRSRLALTEALAISREILDALNFAHSQGVIHRDVKPSNILVKPDGHVCLVDFGIALVVGQRRHTQFGTNIGTPEYMSPEQIQAKKIDHRTDVYSFGCVLYEMLTGRPPFGSRDEGKSEYEILDGHVHKPPPSLRALNPEVDERTETAVLRSLAKNPDERYGGCQELATELNDTVPDSHPSHDPEKDGKITKQTMYIALALLFITLVSVFIFLRKHLEDTTHQDQIVQVSPGVEQAAALVKTATTRGLYIADALKRLAPLRDALQLAKSSGVSPATVDEMQKNLDSLLENIEKALRAYAQSLDQLSKFEKDVREQAFTQYLRELTGTGDVNQITALNMAVKKHLEQYLKRPEGDFAQWKSDFAKL